MPAPRLAWSVLPILAVTVAFLGNHLHVEHKLGRHDATPPARHCADLSPDSPALQRFARALTFRTLSSADTPDHISPGAHDQFSQLLHHLETSYAPVFSALEVQKVGLGNWSRLLTWRGSDATLSPVLFISHYDVVPVTPGTEADWEQPPFSGALAEGYVWGRGSLDVKFSVLALLEAVQQLLQAGWAPTRTVMLSFGHDEEVGGLGGAAQVAALLRQQGVRLDAVVDEGGVILQDGVSGLTQHPVALVGTAEKLYTSVEVRVVGAGGHSSMPPPDGSDVGSQMGRLLSWVAAHPPPGALRSPMPEFLKAIAPVATNRWAKGLLHHADKQPLSSFFVKRFIAGGRETAALVRTTVAATRLRAGVFDNVLPNLGTVSLNVRSHPDVPRAEVLAYVQRAVGAAGLQPGANVTVSPLSHPGPFAGVSPSSGRHFRLLKQAVQEHWRHGDQAVVVAPYLMTGGTDSKHYADLTDTILRFLPCQVNKTAGDLGRIHSTNERVGAVDYLRAICTYRRIIELLAGA